MALQPWGSWTLSKKVRESWVFLIKTLDKIIDFVQSWQETHQNVSGVFNLKMEQSHHINLVILLKFCIGLYRMGSSWTVNM